MAAVWIRNEHEEDKLAALPERLALSALADLERLAGKNFTTTPIPATADDEFLALERRAIAVSNKFHDLEAEGAPREETAPVEEESSALQNRLAREPVTTPAGLAVKLRLIADEAPADPKSDFEQVVIQSALECAERMAQAGVTTTEHPPLMGDTNHLKRAFADNDPVAQIGRDLAIIWRQVWRNDDDLVSAEAHSPESTHLVHLEFHLADRREALETMAAELQAGSLEGAMVQIMLAHAEADLMAASTEESNEAELRTIAKLLYSALAAIEQVVGVPREELGGKAYLTRDLDPHALLAGAEAEDTA